MLLCFADPVSPVASSSFGAFAAGVSASFLFASLFCGGATDIAASVISAAPSPLSDVLLCYFLLRLCLLLCWELVHEQLVALLGVVFLPLWSHF